MTGLNLIRTLSSLALPTMVLLAWQVRRKGSHDGGSESVSAEDSVRSRFRPTRKELLTWIADGRDLTGLDLSQMDLRGSNLRNRRLSGADLSGARLKRARLSEADLRHANLDYADLTGADLRGANLSGASLVETTLWSADLRGADLSNCRNIIMANLRRAQYDSSTSWPGRLDPKELGAVNNGERKR